MKHGHQECVSFLITEVEVDLLREDGKGQNLINYAYKYKKQYLIDQLQEAGVPMPKDVSQKLALQKQKSIKKAGAEENSQQESQEA